MRPNLHPTLVNDRFGDPALFVELLHRREALLFDAGDLANLSARSLLRITHLFISHMHMDHFIGFDALLRVNVGREKTLRVVGPRGTIERVGHKLKAYDWDLAERYQTELLFDVVEVDSAQHRFPEEVLPRIDGCENWLLSAARFAFRRTFDREPLAVPDDWNRPLGLNLDLRVLQHHGPCLGFALFEKHHANVWKNRLEEEGLAPGPWLKGLKDAVLAGSPDETPILLPSGKRQPLGELRRLVSTSPGQKIAYVTDVADTPFNRAQIRALAADADLLVLEASFAADEWEEAFARAHLTTRAAGEIACAAGAKRLEPFHFSKRYVGEEEIMLAEAMNAFGACTTPI